MKREKNCTKAVTAAEFMSKLNQNEEFVRRREEQSKHFKALEKEFAQEEKPLVEALNKAAIPIKSVWDLVNTGNFYPQAIPILVAHLKHPYPFRIREAITRALSIKDAGAVAYAELVREFKELPDSRDVAQHGFKWALGNAISIVADDSNFDEIVELVRDKRHGNTRDMITLRLPNLDPKRAIGVLLELLNDDDDEIVGQALTALEKLKAIVARPTVERFLHHVNPSIRKESAKILARMSRI